MNILLALIPFEVFTFLNAHQQMSTSINKHYPSHVFYILLNEHVSLRSLSLRCCLTQFCGYDDTSFFTLQLLKFQFQRVVSPVNCDRCYSGVICNCALKGSFLGIYTEIFPNLFIILQSPCSGERALSASRARHMQAAWACLTWC